MCYFKSGKNILFRGKIDVDLWQNFYVLILINILSCNSKTKKVSLKIINLPVMPAMLGLTKTAWEENSPSALEKYHGR